MENESDMYHAAATVSTLLLKLGEVTRKFLNTSDENANANLAASKLNGNQEKPSNSILENVKTSFDKKSEDSIESAKNWSITFEQLIASLLTDNLLVQYFDAKYDLNTILIEYKSQHA
jgi:hypothetical protein